MTELVDADRIERIVGAKRHQFLHLGRMVSAEQKVYVLHSEWCRADHDAGRRDLRECRHSLALDNGIDTSAWEGWEDEPVLLNIFIRDGRLHPSVLPGGVATTEGEARS